LDKKSHGIPRIKKLSYNNNPTSYSVDNGGNSTVTNTTNSSRISTRPSVNIKHLLNEANESVTTNLSLKTSSMSSTVHVDNAKLNN
jgi:hypothetical protein